MTSQLTPPTPLNNITITKRQVLLSVVEAGIAALFHANNLHMRSVYFNIFKCYICIQHRRAFPSARSPQEYPFEAICPVCRPLLSNHHPTTNEALEGSETQRFRHVRLQKGHKSHIVLLVASTIVLNDSSKHH